jgi:cytochrome P450
MDRARRATLEVILRLVFGVRDEARVAAFQASIEAWAAAIQPSFIFIPVLARDWLGLSPYARYRKLSERVDEMLYEQIAAVRTQPPADDVLSMLVHARYDDGTGMDDVSLRDNLRTLLFAGHDTTAIILSWALWFVHRNPAILARLREELDALPPDAEPDALTRISYLNAVVDETLRIRPINSETQRRLAKPWQLGEWHIPAGVTVCINQTLLHFDPDLWDQPEQFNPERFMGQPPSASIYAPFGGGNRRCLGATFARYEAAVVLGTVVREYEFEMLDDEIEWKRGTLILEPMSGVNIRVRPRALTRAAA